MLNARINRTPITRSAAVITAIVLLTITLPIAGFEAFAQPSSASVSGFLMDQVGRIMPDATLVLSNVQSQAKHEVRSDQAGYFQATGLPAGDYLLEARIPGFAPTQGRLTLEGGQNLQHNIALQAGSLHETLSVTDRDVPEIARSKGSRGDSEPCSPSPVGGVIRPPVKLNTVKPQYPQKLRNTGVDGTVLLEGRIGVDGLMKDLRIIGQVEPELAAAAADAVRQWLFSQTLMDCVPIEVSIGVTINFSAQP